jgi:hypothetical protein
VHASFSASTVNVARDIRSTPVPAVPSVSTSTARDAVDGTPGLLRTSTSLDDSSAASAAIPTYDSAQIQLTPRSSESIKFPPLQDPTPKPEAADDFLLVPVSLPLTKKMVEERHFGVGMGGVTNAKRFIPLDDDSSDEEG